MRNYRELTDDEVQELERLYPVTPNRELARRYDISVDAIVGHLARPRGWKKNQEAVRIGNRGGRSLTEREVVWIVRHYKHTLNLDIMAKFGIGESTLHRIARKHGLTKSRQQMQKTQRAASEAGRQTCVDYGIYEEHRWRLDCHELNVPGLGYFYLSWQDDEDMCRSYRVICRGYGEDMSLLEDTIAELQHWFFRYNSEFPMPLRYRGRAHFKPVRIPTKEESERQTIETPINILKAMLKGGK